MAERLIEKLDRLGAEAGIKQMTPEVYRFALDVRKDLVAEWPKRPWVGLTEADIEGCVHHVDDEAVLGLSDFARAVEQLLKEKNT